ncbi:unnamed protein product [Closterium sp. NIES-53]
MLTSPPPVSSPPHSDPLLPCGSWTTSSPCFTAGPGGARTRGTGAAGTSGVEGAGVGDPTEPGATRAGGAGARAGSWCPPASPLPAPSPYTKHSGGLTERRELASCPVSPVRSARRVPRSRPPPVPGKHAMALRPSSVALRVPLPAQPESSLPEVPDLESDRSRAASRSIARLLATAVIDPSFESAVVSALVVELGDPDAPDIPTPRSYVEEITGPYSSQWQAAMDAEMASWKSTGTYIDEVPPPWANIVDGMWIFRGVDYFQTFYPTPKMTTLRVLLHIDAQHDYELHSLDFSTAFVQGSLHEETWLRRPPGFTGMFPRGTQWSLWRPVYDLRQAPRKWHDTLRTTLAALGFAPSTADPSLFLRTDTSLPPFYVLVYVDDLVFATGDTEAVTLVKSELQKRHTCTDLGELRSYLGLRKTRDKAQRTITLTQSHMVHQVLQRFGFQYSLPQPTPLSTSHSLSAPPSDESVEPSGPYLELVGCLKYLMTCTRPDLAYPLSLLARYVAPARHRKWSSQGYTFSLGSGSVSWRSTRSSSVLSSSCEAEIYAGAMAAQELRWLTYLLSDLGEQPRSPPVLYQRGQLRLAYVATRANTADIFTKALPPGDHQRFSTVLGIVPTLPHLLTA